MSKQVKCPLCGSLVTQSRIRQAMSEKASRPRPSIKGTQAATDRARKAALARHSKKKGQADSP
jgi:hypothetical protein